MNGQLATQPSPGTAAKPAGRLVRAGLAVFALGLAAIVATFLDYAFGDGNRPLWQNLLCVLAPIGFGMAIAGLVRNARAENRAIAAAVAGAEYDHSPPSPARPAGRTERGFAWIAIAEATSWLLLIVATVVKYAAGDELGVKILGPVHGGLFILYVGLVLVVARRQRWRIRTLLVVGIDSVLPGGGYLVARRRDLRPSPPAGAR